MIKRLLKLLQRLRFWKLNKDFMGVDIARGDSETVYFVKDGDRYSKLTPAYFQKIKDAFEARHKGPKV